MNLAALIKTLTQLEQLSAAMDCKENNNKESNTDFFSSIIGKYVIVRSRNEGVNFGEVVKADKGLIHLKDARRLHYFAPLNKSECWYEGVAQSGVSSDSRLSGFSEKVISEDYSVTLCSESAVKNIMEHKQHEQQ